MATIIQLRRGSYTNFDPQKMKPGELAVVQSNDPVGDGKALYFCVSAGVVKRLSSYEDIVSAVQDATNEVAEMFIEQVSDDVERAEAAAESVEQEAQQIDTNTQDIADLKSDLTQIEEDMTHIGISESVKVALLNCFSHVVWIDEHGQEYYDALDTALYEEGYPRIVAVFNPGSQTIYVDDDLNTLKQYLVVKYQASRDAADIIIPSSEYTLSGTLAEGNNVVRVAYNDLFTTFTVTAVDYYNQSNWTYPGLLKMMDESAGLSDAGGIGYEMRLNGATTPPVRASFWAQRGISGQLPALRMDGSREQGTYCIPVPDSASHAIVSITPSSQYISVRRLQYDLSTQTWINTRAESGWTQGSVDYAIPESSYMRFVQVNCKFNSGGTAGDLPTGLSITFE